MTTELIAELFYCSHDHRRFNTVANTCRARGLLFMAAQDDAAAFLIKYPAYWTGYDPVNLTEQIASDFVDRGLVAIRTLQKV